MFDGSFGVGTKGEEVSVSFLPLSHVTARHADFALLYRGVVLAYCPDIKQLAQALAEVRPATFIAVPRVYEKIRQQVILKATGFPKAAVYRWALSVGRAHRAETLDGTKPSALSWKIADRLVFSKVRAGMGGKAEEFISGGAPLGRELAEWYADIGIPIHEGYGLTETSPVIAVSTPGAHKLGTVGKPLANVEVRIADDGEVLVRGPSVFKGYWNRPEETRDAFVDGWFKTGDIGQLDSEGYLSITDRGSIQNPVLDMPRPGFLAAILYGRAEPDMRRGRPVGVAGIDVLTEARTPLGQNLEFMPMGIFHHVEDTIDEAEGDFLVKQVAHRVDEDHPRFAPPQRLFQPFGAELKIEAILKGVARHATEPLREPFGIAIVAAGTDLRATRDRVPRRVSPFYRR